MRVPEKASAVTRYNNLKAVLDKAAHKPSNAALFRQDGDRFELTQNARIPLDGQDVIVKKGSAFDNDVTTPDTISVETTVDGTVQQDTFKHFSEKRGLIFKRDQEMLDVSFRDTQGLNFSSTGAIFEI